MSTFEQLQNVISITLGIPAGKITEATTNNDLSAWDSLGHVNLMIALEESFDIYLDVEDFPKLISVPAILDYLREQGTA